MLNATVIVSEPFKPPRLGEGTEGKPRGNACLPLWSNKSAHAEPKSQQLNVWKYRKLVPFCWIIEGKTLRSRVKLWTRFLTCCGH